MKTIKLSTFFIALFILGCIRENPVIKKSIASEPATPSTSVEKKEEEKKECPMTFPNQKLCASLTWINQPTDDVPGSFKIHFWNQDTGTENGPYQDPSYSVGVKLWMSSMGHGSSPVKVAQAKDEAAQPITGVYNATDVYFVMGGDWEIWIQLKQGKQVVEQAKTDYIF